MVNLLPNISDEHRFNLAQACRVLGISRPTFYRKAAEANIKRLPFKAGGRIYYSGKDIKRIWQNG